MAPRTTTPLSRTTRVFSLLLIASLGGAFHARAEESVTLTVGYVLGEGLGFPADAFLEAHPGIRIDPVPMERTLSGLYASSLTESLLSLPDIFAAYVGQGSDDLESLVDAEFLVSLDTVAPELALDDYFPNVLEAVRYRGRAWLLPFSVNCAVLCYDRRVMARAGVALQSSSWEALFASAGKVADPQGDGTGSVGFLESTSHLPICEYMANAAGAPAFDPANPDLFRSSQMLRAYELLLGAIDRGAVTPQPGLLVLRPGAAMGINNFTCLESNEHYGIIPLPERIREGDLPGAGPSVKAMLRCLAVRKNTPEKLAAARELIMWLTSRETQMLLLERSDATVPHAERNVKSVYVPLLEPVVESDSFDAFVEQRPGYEHLVHLCRTVYFPRLPAALEVTAYGAAHAVIERLREDEGLGAALAAAHDEVLAVTRGTAVESTEFDQF